MITVSGLEPKRYRITPGGIEELSRQLAVIRRQRIQIANEMRDISSESGMTNALEDSAMTISRSRAAEIDDQIMLLERIIATAHVIQQPRTNECVQIGSRVWIQVNEAKYQYIIVGPLEANPTQGKISNESPFGQSLLGKRVNDHIEIAPPRSDAVIAKIISIEIDE